MYLKKSKRKSGRIYLSIADGYYDPQRGHSRTKTIEKIGYADAFADQYEDPTAHFEEVVAYYYSNKSRGMRKEENKDDNARFNNCTTKSKFLYQTFNSIQQMVDFINFICVIDLEKSVEIINRDF